MGLFEKKTEDEKILEFVENYKLEELDRLNKNIEEMKNK